MSKIFMCDCGKPATTIRDYLITEVNTAKEQGHEWEREEQKVRDAGIVRVRFCNDCLSKAAAKYVDENKKHPSFGVLIFFGIALLLVLGMGIMEMLSGRMGTFWFCLGLVVLAIAIGVPVYLKRLKSATAEVLSAEKIAKGDFSDLLVLNKLVYTTIPGGLPAGSGNVPDSSYMLMDDSGRVNFERAAGFEIKRRIEGGSSYFYSYPLPQHFTDRQHPLVSKWEELVSNTTTAKA
jgi:uncharacterized protein (DUF2164 family)